MKNVIILGLILLGLSNCEKPVVLEERNDFEIFNSDTMTINAWYVEDHSTNEIYDFFTSEGFTYVAFEDSSTISFKKIIYYNEGPRMENCKIWGVTTTPGGQILSLQENKYMSWKVNEVQHTSTKSYIFAEGMHDYHNQFQTLTLIFNRH